MLENERMIAVAFLIKIMVTVAQGKEDSFSRIVLSNNGIDFEVQDLYDRDTYCEIPTNNAVENGVAPKSFVAEVIRDHLVVCGDFLPGALSCTAYNPKTKKWDERARSDSWDSNNGPYYMSACPNSLENPDQFIIAAYPKVSRPKTMPKFYQVKLNQVLYMPNVTLNYYYDYTTSRVIFATGEPNQCTGFMDDNPFAFVVNFTYLNAFLAADNPEKTHYHLELFKPPPNESHYISRASTFLHPHDPHDVPVNVVQDSNGPNSYSLYFPGGKKLHYDFSLKSNIDLSEASKFIRLRSTFGVFLPKGNRLKKFFTYATSKEFKDTKLVTSYDIPRFDESQVALGAPKGLVECRSGHRPPNRNPVTTTTIASGNTIFASTSVNGEPSNNATTTVSSAQFFSSRSQDITFPVLFVIFMAKS